MKFEEAVRGARVRVHAGQIHREAQIGTVVSVSRSQQGTVTKEWITVQFSDDEQDVTSYRPEELSLHKDPGSGEKRFVTELGIDGSWRVADRLNGGYARTGLASRTDALNAAGELNDAATPKEDKEEHKAPAKEPESKQEKSKS
jgi:hypothetical protein